MGSIENRRAKYGHERDKRFTDRGNDQYTVLHQSSKFQDMIRDIWVAPGTPINRPVPDGAHVKIVIYGAGLGGIIAAVSLLKAGFHPHDILIVDPAGGFGGTWYYNRYPGLACDIESYIYLPFLEETGFVPSKKYIEGHEIRRYINLLVEHFGLDRRVMFQTTGHKLEWDEAQKQWVSELRLKPADGTESTLKVKSDFAWVQFGVLPEAKIPDLPGLDSFKGSMFHTARWNYALTGGTQENPLLSGLEGKRVGIVGTGATMIQAFPHITKHAKETYLFQRTPSSVDTRDNRPTDPVEWKTKIASRPGWWKERATNFDRWTILSDEKPSENLVDDQWTRLGTYGVLIGCERQLTMENLMDYIEEMEVADDLRQERIRRRAHDLVKNQQVAEKLEPWHHTWCKRPCFHDEYLPSFNRPGVHLIDTDGQGVTGVTPNGLEVNGTEYPVDMIIWASGYTVTGNNSPAAKGNLQINGKKGISLEEAWVSGLDSLHGWTAPGFPNLVWAFPIQSSASANYTHYLTVMSEHIAQTLAAATKQVGGKPIVEAKVEAVKAWGDRLAMGALKGAPMASCTPGYLNGEGAMRHMTDEQKAQLGRKSLWAAGLTSFEALMEEWRVKGDFDGLDITKA